ncbi:MAG: ankyrin repeat domain-containing protein [Planctomycetota bacterium]|jgi:ankyrin repeat protein
MKKLMLSAFIFSSIFFIVISNSTPILNAGDTHKPSFGNCLYRLDIEEVSKLLEEGADPNERCSRTGRSTLNRTIGGLLVADAMGTISPQVEEKAIKVLELLFNAGAEIRPDDNSILHGPVIAGAKNVTKYLLDKGANYNGLDDRGNTPLTLAAEFKHPEIIELLEQYGAEPLDDSINEQIILISAARRGDLAAVKQSLSDGALVNGKNQSGETALTVAIREGRLTVVEELLSSGADPNLSGPYIGLGYSPLHLAVFKPRSSFEYGAAVEILITLLENGADVSSDNGYKKQTPLHIAVEMNNEIAVRILIEAGSKVLVRDDDGMTPLDYAESESIINLFKSYSIIETP